MLLYRWLIQRANGILALRYAPADPLEQSASKLARQCQIVANVLPQLPALLSPAAEVRLDLRSGELPKPLPGTTRAS